MRFNRCIDKMVSLKKFQCVVLLLAIVSTRRSLAQEVQITVDVNCNNYVSGSSCVELDEVLSSFDSGMTLYLQPGVHTVYNSTIVRDLTNISIIGMSETSRDSVIITCSEAQGLSFSNITGLFLTNVTISNCGLSGEQLAKSVAILRDQMDMFIVIPTSLQVALFMGVCKDVSMVNVAVTNTSGVGLIGVNILGISLMSGVDFTYNRYSSCIADDFPKIIGGGAYFFYGDVSTDSQTDSFQNATTSLLLTGSRFEYNSDCSLVALVEANYQYIVSGFGDALYTVGGGGGLTVFLAQRDFPINVSVTSCTFYRNSARYGGGAHVGFFSGVELSQVYFSDCIFDSNHGEMLENGGAGLAVFTGLYNPLYDNMTIATDSVRVFVTGSAFVRNRAVKGGGLFTFSLFNGQTSLLDTNIIETFSVLFIVVNCSFFQNSGLYGAGLSSTQRIDYGYNGKVALVIGNSTIAENTHIGKRKMSEVANTDSSAFLLESVVAIALDSLEISDNTVTGMHILSSLFVASRGASVTFSRNNGLLGGAVHLAGIIPVISVVFDSNITFIENRATLRGGAIYVTPRVMSADDILLPLNDECFFLPLSSENCGTFEECYNLSALNVHVSFHGNEAPLGGAVYGSTLESCLWVAPIKRFRDRVAPNLHILQFIAIRFPNVIDIDTGLNDSSTVSTVPSQIVVNASQAELMPGQVTRLTITVMDDYNNEVPSVISSLVSSYSDNSSTAVSTIGESGFWFADMNTAEARFDITGLENTYVNVTFFTTDTVAAYQVTFKLNSCPLGTIFDYTLSSCVCDPRIYTQGIQCDEQTFNITIPNNVWVGTMVESNTSDNLIIQTCLTGCNKGPNSFNAFNFNTQCSSRLGRAGILCSGCAQNKSAVFGSRGCQHCSNFYLLLIPVFALAGVALFVAVALLGLTIDKGWINIVLFYCNILSLHGSILSTRYNLNGLFVPPSLLSLQIGTGLCFYDGMTALAKTGFQLIFPAYLYLLMFIFALLCRKFYWLSEHFSPTTTFVTLTIMSYVSSLSTISDIMAGVTLRTLGGDNSIHWQIDLNQQYFNGFHALLVVLAIILCVVYIIPVPLFLLFPTLLYKYGKKYKPFYDALWAPFRMRFRFWLGVRLIVLLIIFSLPRIFYASHTLITILVLFTLQYLQLVIKPFTSPRVNYVDNFLSLTLTFLLVGAEYIEFYSNGSSTELAIEYIILAVIVGAGYVTVVALFYLQLSQNFPLLKTPFRHCTKKQSPKPPTAIVTHTEVSLDDIQSPSQSIMQLSNFEIIDRERSAHELRESLLED